MPPPIPLQCAFVPVGPDGILRGFVLVRYTDGSSNLADRSLARTIECWARGLCQLCGQGIERSDGFVALGHAEDVRDLLFQEPPLHRWCADYLVKVDPRFREGTWYALHAMAYELAVSSENGETYGGIVNSRLIRTVRLLRPDGGNAERYRDVRALREQLLADHPREEIPSA
jgi:hypothetical protein